MPDDLIYVYCLSDTPFTTGLPDGIPGLESVNAGGFYVTVKHVSGDEFSEENLKRNLSDLQWLDVNAREHIRVISLVMETCAVVPFSFGTIFQSAERLLQFTSLYADSLAENLQHTGMKKEWAVKMYCDRKKLSARIDEISIGANVLEKQIMASSPGKAFLLRRKKADLIENEMDRFSREYGQEYYNGLKNLSEGTVFGNLLPKEFTGREDDMILNAAFLVRNENSAGFITEAGNLNDRFSHLGFSSEITGPWPPFSFISIKEKQHA